jgi:hypothetical protein
MDILEKANSSYGIRRKNTEESLTILNVISNSLLCIYLQNEDLFPKEYLIHKRDFIHFMENLRIKFDKTDNEIPDVINEEKELLIELKKFRNKIKDVSRFFSLKNFSGNHTFDYLINSFSNLIQMKSIKTLEPSPIYKYAILETVEEVKVMILKTEIQMLVSLLLKENKIDSQFADFINDIFEELEDKYEELKIGITKQENERKWNDLKSNQPKDAYQNEILKYIESLNKTILDKKITDAHKQALASQFSSIISNLPNHLNHFSKIPSLPFLPKSQEEFLVELENKGKRGQIRFLILMLNGCLDIMEKLD